MNTPGQISVLLIEDDEDDYFLTLDLFEAIEIREFVVTWASDVTTGIEQLRSGEFDICLIDYRLGAVTGVDVLQDCKEALRTTPAIVLTGDHSHEVDNAALRAGASDYLVKGELSADSLERAVRYALQRNASDARIEYLAFHDPLTELPNRILFADRVRQALARTERNSDHVFVIFFDLDNFKDINDTRGHQAGDLLLTQVANRIRGTLRSNDTLARLGGDEFAMCIEGPPSADLALYFVRRVQDALRRPFDLDGASSVMVTASFGIASTFDTSADPEELLRNADIAMYEAKRAGKDTWARYERSMHESLQRRIALERDLHQSILDGSIEVHYQPFISLDSGKIVGFEALCRWTHSALGPQSPNEFIHLAESTGLIMGLGDYVLNEAASALAHWQDVYGFGGFVSVNVSPQQIAHGEFVNALNAVLDRTELDPSRLTIEFTESVMTGDVETTVAVLSKLAEVGVGVALDDFGTGYSSLSNVHQLPISVLKVDRSFVAGFNDRKGLSMLMTIATMASSLGVTSIAEGIETDEQLGVLRALGFSIGQGFLFAEAVPMDEVPALLESGIERAMFT